MLLVGGYLAQNLFAMQVLQINNQDMRARFQAAVPEPQVQPALRGTIVDVHDRPLVSTVTVFKVIAYPPYVTDASAEAKALLPILFPTPPQGKAAHDKKAVAKARAEHAVHYQALLNTLNSPEGYVCLAGDGFSCAAKSLVSETVWIQVRNLRLTGIDAEPRSMPSYPNGSLASHVLGYVTYDTSSLTDKAYRLAKSYVGVGQYGLENYYDSLLSGVSGHVTVRQDTSGTAIRVGGGSDEPAQQGATLTLTLDSYVQLLVEQELARVVKNFHATGGGTIIVERPSDGAILAMASTPDYNPSNWQQTFLQQGNSRFIDPAVSQQYEPGSTFKAFTVAIGLDSGSFNQYTPIEDDGTFKTDGIIIRNWCLDSCSFGGTETVRKMLQFSSNIGAAKFSQYIRPVTFYDYLDRFGFGQATGVDLAGEATGEIRRPSDVTPVWVPSYKDTQAYGQGISVTPLQLANAYAALANGGKLMRPHLLQSYTLSGKTYVVQPQVVRQVVSPATSDLMRRILVDSAIDGEACKALVPGYDIAAKTGTASIPSLGGNYYANTTIASTAAFAPADDPKFVILAIVNKPNVQWGSVVAAPVIHDIAQRLFDYYGIPKSPASELTQPANSVCTQPGST